jgi:hypothetical protein
MKIFFFPQIQIHAAKIYIPQSLLIYFATMPSETLKFKQNTHFPISNVNAVDLNSRFFFMGSCFSENMAARLEMSGMNCYSNPFGILYNPYSIAAAVERIASEYRYSAHDFTYHAGEFHSMQHHGSFKHKDAESLSLKINTAIEQAHEFLTTADIAIITPGTAKIWQMREPSMIVGNCHKIPNHEFNARILTDTEIQKAIIDTIYNLRLINPGITIMYTISPVKHLREGIQENLVSKSRLISALASVRAEHPEILYFPAYEIVTEELRDHRYYAEDLAHPSEWTIQYIFQRFCESHMPPRTLEYITEAWNWLRMKRHRPGAENNEMWGKQCSDALEQLQKRFPEKLRWPTEWL